LAGILKRICTDPARARRLGDRARAIAQDYSWRTIALRHLHLYQTLRTGKILRQSA
jgi:glycosyltransferase involved in cell wall biosynthesis